MSRLGEPRASRHPGAAVMQALFFPRRAPYNFIMASMFGWVRRVFPAGGALINEEKGGPWGRGPGGGKPGGGGGWGGGGGPKNPWGGGGGPRRRPAGVGNVTSLDDFLKRSRERIGNGMQGGGPGRAIWLYALLGFLALWLLFTSIHRVGPQERGVVTTLGDYSRTLGPGMHVTFPAPIDRVQTLDVENVRRVTVPNAGTGENLVLTGDQNIVDLAYAVRWNVRDPEQYLFQIADPDDTIPEVAEAAMRAVVAQFTLDQAIGEQRGLIESRVQDLMQRVLDGYRAGVRVQGVEIRQAAAPGAVNEAFNAVIEAQQRSQSALNQARSYASQVTARAQGDAGQFDRVYEEYRQAPDVTRRRIYYETMEQVLSKVDKTIVETPGVTPYLPLPELGRNAPRPAPASPTTGTARPSASSGATSSTGTTR